MWGPVGGAVRRGRRTRHLSYRVKWGRSSTVPLETFVAVSRKVADHGENVLDVWASIQMPKFPDQMARALRLPGNAVRVHFRTWTWAAATASSAASSTAVLVALPGP